MFRCVKILYVKLSYTNSATSENDLTVAIIIPKITIGLYSNVPILMEVIHSFKVFKLREILFQSHMMCCC